MGALAVRHARAQDFRRRLQQNANSWPTRIRRVSFSGVPSLGDAEIPLLSPVSVFSGPNGVGKTTLLRLVWSVLDPAGATAKIPSFAKLKTGRAAVEIDQRGVQAGLTRDFANQWIGEEPGLEVSYINTSSDSARIQVEFSKIDDLEDIINGVGPIGLNADQLNEINYLTMRNYREVKLYEVELADDVVPFFEVSYGPDRYDSRTMGSGELSAFFLWWKLWRAPRNSILLLEEPECFLSPVSQSAFVDVLLSTICSKKICAVVSSHSAEIISPLPQDCVRFFRRAHSGVALVTEKPSPILLETIGIKCHRDVLAFVEDAAAARFCRLLAERFDSTLARRMVIVPKNGDGEIVNLLRQIDGHYESLTILGIFDGDAVGKLPHEVAEKASFLPGDQPIEKLFKALAEQQSVALQDAIGQGNVGEALFALQGRDHHDWFLELARHLGLEASQMFMVLFGLWMRAGENEQLARLCFEKIQQRVYGTPVQGS